MAVWLVPTPLTQFISHVYIALRGAFSYILDDAVDRAKSWIFNFS